MANQQLVKYVHSNYIKIPNQQLVKYVRSNYIKMSIFNVYLPDGCWFGLNIKERIDFLNKYLGSQIHTIKCPPMNFTRHCDSIVTLNSFLRRFPT